MTIRDHLQAWWLCAVLAAGCAGAGAAEPPDAAPVPLFGVGHWRTEEWARISRGAAEQDLGPSTSRAGSIRFYVGDRERIRVDGDGTFWLNGRKAGSDRAVLEGFRRLFNAKRPKRIFIVRDCECEP